MKEDEMIQAILTNQEYSRPYFRESLIEQECTSYYCPPEKEIILNTPEAIEAALIFGNIRIHKKSPITVEQYLNLSDKKDGVEMIPKYYNIKSINGSKVILETGEEIPLQEAIESFYLIEHVSYYDYKADPNNPEYEILPGIGWSRIVEKDGNFELIKESVSAKIHYVPSITEKMNQLETKRSR